MKLNEVHNIDEAMMAGGQEAYATEAKPDAYTRDQMAATSGFGRKPREHDTGDDEPSGVFTVVIDGRDWKTATSNEAFRMATAVARKHPGKRVQVRWPTGQLNTVAEALAMGMEEEFVGEPEHDGSTFKNSLHTIHRVAVYLNKNISADDDIPEWVAEKMGAAKGMLTSVMQYLISEKEMHHGESGMFEQGMTEGLDGRASATPAINKRGKFTSWDENEPMRLKCQDGEFRTIQEINVLRQKMGMKPFSIKGDQGVAEGSLEEVDRRGFLKGLGAAAVAGAAGYKLGQPTSDNSVYKNPKVIFLLGYLEGCKEYITPGKDVLEINTLINDYLAYTKGDATKLWSGSDQFFHDVGVYNKQHGIGEPGYTQVFPNDQEQKAWIQSQGKEALNQLKVLVQQKESVNQGVAEGELTEASVKHVMGRYQVVHNGKVVGTYNAKYEAQDRANHLNDTAKRMPRGNYSDEAHPIRDDGNEAPDYAAMYESKLVEFAGGMGAGSVATAPGVGKGSNVGSLFGGSYSPKNSPFKKTKAKKESVIKR